MTIEKISFKREKLKKQYINQDVRDSYNDAITTTNEWINTKLKDALEGEGLVFDLELINRLSAKPQAIKDVIAEHRTKYINSLGVIPPLERDRIFSMYLDMIEQLEGICNDFYHDATKYAHPLSKNKNGSITFDKVSVSNHIETLGVRTFSDSDIAYMDKLQDAAELLTEIRNFEIENDYNPFVLNALPAHLNGFTPSEVFSDRAIKRNREYDKLRERNHLQD